MNIHYYNWSGISLQHAGAFIGFDLYGEAVTWDVLKNDQPKLLCVTHGHPEHAGSLRRFLEAPEARPYLENIHLISSPAVTAHINRRNILLPANVHRIKAGESITLNEIKITAFTWVHMPLLPPGFKHKVDYLLQLALHPFDLLRIGSQGLRLPMNAPQLGFHVRYPDGTTVLNYAEGVHRLTNPQEVQRVARILPADMLLFAVEPDDAESIPRWVEMLSPQEVYLYEAHRPWRDLFHLPFIDLEVYRQRLQQQFQTIVFHALTQPGIVQ
ncbi:MAG TPA: MBL fold metallo-hydrolase [Aggregatilineales bacterium]|nr:MBL fold metallo-hydrolase [Anaerolineales bacterium]HRE46644.1 MBL fold metallo-hydrolase [Aggregatilineales bacterium]